MKKLNAKKIIAETVISMGLVIPLTATNNGALLSQPQTVQAATKKITLKHNAYLYNYRGRRVGRRKLYRHHTYTYYSIKRIHGKKYYRVGKNSYIKASNVLTKKHTNKAKTPSNLIPETNSKLSLNTSGLGTPKFQVSIDKTNADIYSTFHAIPHGSWIGTLKLDGTYNVYAEENDMYEIGNGQWIKSGIAEVISNNSSQNGQENTSQSSDSNISAKSSNITASSSKNTNKPATSKKSHKDEKNNPSEADLQDAANRFLAMVNEDRAKLGIKPLTLNAHLSAEAKQRSIHDAAHLVKYGTEDKHVDENGNLLLPDDTREEICSPLSRNADIAEFAYFEFMKNDATANWAHKKALLNPEYSEIGIGITIGNGPSIYTYGSLTCEFN